MTHEHWQRAAWSLAIVAGIFTIFVLALLLANGQRGIPVAVMMDGRIGALKTELQAKPTDTTLKEDIRTLDRRARTAFFRSELLAERGMYLLLIGLGVCLLAAKYARARTAAPVPANLLPDPRRSAARARATVATAGAVITVALMATAWAGRLDVSNQYAALAAPTEAPATFPSAEDIAKQWPRFRGPNGSGVAPTAGTLPMAWDGAKGTNILWKTKIPLPGESSPVVWGDNIFLTGANEHQRAVYCLDATTGKIRWTQPVIDLSCADKTELHVMEDTGYAAATMATDGTSAAAFFANGDLACFDVAGKRRWAKNLGHPDSMYGHASSLIIWHNLLILQFDQGTDPEAGESALLAFDLATGKEIWRTERPVPNSWSTPILIDTGEREEIITTANPWIIAYNPSDGKELWRAECLGGDVAPSPIFAVGLIFACNTGSNLVAIKPDGTGDVTKSHMVWNITDDLPDTVSPISDGKLVLVVSSYGNLTCFDAKTGKVVWNKMLDGEFRASPTLVGDKLYLMDRNGLMRILQFGRAFKALGIAKLGEKSDNAPAILNGYIYLRGKTNLYCIGTKP